MLSATDHAHMARALHLAARGLYGTEPNPRVGCVLVQDDRVVGEGWHERAGGPHAEVNALRAAGEAARGATAYVTLEPCCHQGRTGPCTRALVSAGVSRVVAAMEDPNPRVEGRGLAELRAAGIQVASGVLEPEARALNPGFVSRMARGRPFVRCKLAASIDGRTAMASGESRWITGEAARMDVQRLRARSSAILTGVGTVLADDPALTVRADALTGEGGIAKQPLRVVLDSRLRMPVTARLLKEPGETVLYTVREADDRACELGDAGARVETVEARDGRVALERVLERLAAREVNELHLEAGPTLCGAMAGAGLVDEFVIYLAPSLMGADARGMFALPGVAQMAQRLALSFTDVRAIGDDLRVTAEVREPVPRGSGNHTNS